MAEKPDPEKSFMTAKFSCPKCSHSWIKIRSKGLPEKCEKCQTKGCATTEYREATRPEQLQGKKMVMVAKYKCDVCREKWKSVNSSGSPKQCMACKRRGDTSIVEPYKYRKAKKEELKPKRKFGFFKCPNCSNEWPSAYTWVGKYQECKKCNSKAYAHSIQPLKPGGGGGLFKKSHDDERCEKCKELKHNCRLYRAGEDAAEVDFEEGKSVISVASSTSTDVSQEREDDVTPTVSDDEEQVDEFLGDKLKNMRL